MVTAAEAEAGGAGDLQEWGTMVAAPEAGGAGDWQNWRVKEELQAEDQDEHELMEAFSLYYKDDACDNARTGTKYNQRTGNKLSPLAVCNSGQFGIEEMSKDENGPWRSPRTDPPTEVKY